MGLEAQWKLCRIFLVLKLFSLTNICLCSNIITGLVSRRLFACCVQLPAGSLGEEPLKFRDMQMILKT